MPKFLDTRSNKPVAIAICARCSRKFPYTELFNDPNYPGLWVCADDLDNLDPYRLPARETEDITLEHPRPDVSLSPGSTAVYANEINGIAAIQQPQTWQANTIYAAGAQVTPINPYGPKAPYLIFVYLCVVAGTSGATAPAFPANQGQRIVDGTVTWQNAGLFEP